MACVPQRAARACPLFCPQHRRPSAIPGDTGRTGEEPTYRGDDTHRQPLNSGDTAGLGLRIRCFLTFTGKPFMLQPDDNCDDDACGQGRTQSNSQALLREENGAVAAMSERTRTGGNVFLNRVAQVRFLSGPPINSALTPHHNRRGPATTPKHRNTSAPSLFLSSSLIPRRSISL